MLRNGDDLAFRGFPCLGKRRHAREAVAWPILRGEILRFYVDRSAHGRGVAASLMHTCLSELRSRGSGVAWLGVWERNPRAITFYRKSGFAPVGAHVFVVGSDPQRDVVMQRSLLV